MLMLKFFFDKIITDSIEMNNVYLKKFGKSLQHSFGLLVQNIGPPVAFIDAEQADPAPTNMKFGIYSRLYLSLIHI